MGSSESGGEQGISTSDALYQTTILGRAHYRWKEHYHRTSFMGEAKRRKKLDPNFGKIPGPSKRTKLDLKLLEKYMDLPLSEHSEPEHSQLVEQGLEQLFLMAKEAGVEMPPMPTDPEEKQRFLHQFKQGMAHSRLELPDGRIIE